MNNVNLVLAVLNGYIGFMYNSVINLILCVICSVAFLAGYLYTVISGEE